MVKANSLKILPGILDRDQLYTVSVTASYFDINGTAEGSYETGIDRDYTFEIEPSLGTAFSTDFYLVASTQEIETELNSFTFGFYKDRVKYLLTRNSPVPRYTLQLPQGDTSNKLTVFCEITNKEGKAFMMNKTVTVTAPSITTDDFETYVEYTLSDSINESIQLRLQYEYLNESLSSDTKISAIDLIFDGLQRDGTILELNQDEATSLTVAQTLKSVSEELATLENEEIITRSFNIFKQMTITENTEVLTNNKIIVLSEEVFRNLFTFADNLMTKILVPGAVLTNSTLISSIKTELLEGLEYIIRGSMTTQMPNNDGLIIEGESISVISSRVMANGYSDAISLAPSRANRRQLDLGVSSIEIPGSALPSTEYAQITIIATTDTIYDVTLSHSDGELRSSMVRVLIESNDQKLGDVGTKALSTPLTVEDLEDPIIIEIPFTGTIDTNRTISCGFTSPSISTVRFTGVTSQINSDTVACSTTHLTDFVLEEHEDPNVVYEDLKYPDNSVEKLDVYKAFAFWVSLILFGALYPLIRFTVRKDREEAATITPYIKASRTKLNVYNTFWNKIPVRPPIEEADVFNSANLPYTGLDVTSNAMAHNVTTYMAPRVTMTPSGSNGHYKEDPDENSSPEPGTAQAVTHMPREESKSPPSSFIGNLFSPVGKDNSSESIDNTGANSNLNPEVQDEITLHINKRKNKKRKKRTKRALNDEEEEKANDQQEEEIKQQKPLPAMPTFDNTYLNHDEKKKEFKFEMDDDYEGGEGDEETNGDKIRPYDDAIDYQDGAMLGLRPKKRKRLLKKKKPKKKHDDEENNTSAQAFEPEFTGNLFHHNEDQPELSQVRDNDENKGATVLDQKDIDAMNDTLPDKEEEHKNVPKRRFYNAKYFFKTLWLGHRYVNFYSAYNDQIPRLWRLLLLYNEVFIIMLLCGVVFYNPGPSEDTHQLNGYNSFFYAILILGFDRLLHFGVVWAILRYKKADQRKNEYLDPNERDFNIHDNTMNRTDKDIFGTELNKTDQDFHHRVSHTGNGFHNNISSSPRSRNAPNNIDVSEFDKDERNDTDPEHERDDKDGVRLSSPDEKANGDVPSSPFDSPSLQKPKITYPPVKYEQKDKRIFRVLLGTTIFVLAFCFAFTIVMGVRYSNHSGYVWMVAIMDVLFFGHAITEPLVLFGTGLLIHRKLWKITDLY